MGSIGTNGVDKAEEQKMVGDDGYQPNKNDFEAAYRAIALSGTTVPISEVLARLEKDAAESGIELAAGWAEKLENEDLPEWVK